MLKKPVYVNYQHEIAVEAYFDLVYVTIKEICGQDTNKFEDFIYICNIIIEHHNNYKTQRKTDSPQDARGLRRKKLCSGTCSMRLVTSCCKWV